MEASGINSSESWAAGTVLQLFENCFKILKFTETKVVKKAHLPLFLNGDGATYKEYSVFWLFVNIPK